MFTPPPSPPSPSPPPYWIVHFCASKTGFEKSNSIHVRFYCGCPVLLWRNLYIVAIWSKQPPMFWLRLRTIIDATVSSPKPFRHRTNPTSVTRNDQKDNDKDKYKYKYITLIQLLSHATIKTDHFAIKNWTNGGHFVQMWHGVPSCVDIKKQIILSECVRTCFCAAAWHPRSPAEWCEAVRRL